MDEQKLIEDIRKHGWAVMLIEATEYLPSFAYTVGLWKNYNHPELISFGLPTKTLHSVVNIGGELAKGGHHLEVGRNYDDFFEDRDAQLIQVDQRSLKDYFGYAIWFHGATEFQALQLVWTDQNDKFPWDRDFDEDLLYRQPLLDRNADFKFREEKNLSAFTTRQWLEEKKAILRIVHDEDGDWQFLTGDQMPEDIRIVALEQMILSDQTLNDVFNLDYGESAERSFVGDKWTRSSVHNAD